jgi:hypothetical protein
MNVRYECAISGVEEEASVETSAPLGGLPLGWFKITFIRQVLNPKWIAIQQLKEAMTNNVLNQIPKAEDREIQQVAVTLQVEAQFAALEAATPKYITQEEVVYTAPPEAEEAIRDVFNEIREPLGLGLFTTQEEQDEQDDKEALAAQFTSRAEAEALAAEAAAPKAPATAKA